MTFETTGRRLHPYVACVFFKLNSFTTTMPMTVWLILVSPHLLWINFSVYVFCISTKRNLQELQAIARANGSMHAFSEFQHRNTISNTRIIMYYHLRQHLTSHNILQSSPSAHLFLKLARGVILGVFLFAQYVETHLFTSCEGLFKWRGVRNVQNVKIRKNPLNAGLVRSLIIELVRFTISPAQKQV